MASRVISYRDAINEALRLEMRRDPTIILLGEDIAGGAGVPHLEEVNAEAWGGCYGVTHDLATEFGRDRVRDTPISESAYVGAAVGAAASGLRPIAEVMFVDFTAVCFDQIVNQAAKLRYLFGGKAEVPLVIRTTIGAGFRAAAQHSQCLYSIFTHIPGLKTVIPATPYDAKGLLIAAIRDNDPVIFFEHKLLYSLTGEVPVDSYTLPLGTAHVKRTGHDLTVVAVGRMVHKTLEAANELAKEGIDVEVVDLRTLSPLDEDAIIDSVRKTNRLIVVDED
jgi:pyruvate dehydrogenase E1 component beta subunit